MSSFGGVDWERREREARALATPSTSLRLPLPAYGGRSIPNVTASIVRSLGTKAEDGPPLAPPLDDDLDPFEGRRAEGPTVVLLVDGFGWYPFTAWARAGTTPQAGPWGAHSRPITTVFPTTTVSALTSLSGATSPAQHGVVGPMMYLPTEGVVADILRMNRVDRPGSEELVTPTWNPRSVSAAPSIFSRGVHGVALSRHQFRHTGFNRILYEGAEYAGYSTASDLAHLLEEILRRPSPPPLTFVYWDELDTVHHLRGPDDALTQFEADRIAGLIRHVARRLDPATARSTRLLVTADHGQVAVDPARQVRVDLIPEIAGEMARPLAGDRRAGFFAAKPGRSAPLRAALEAHLPEGRRVVSMEQAVAGGLFGPPPFHPELTERLGDFLVLLPVPSGLLTPRLRRESRSPEFRGSHSGLEPEELVVPLIAGTLAELGGSDDPPGQP